MRAPVLLVSTIAVAALVVGASSPAHAQSATFTHFDDAVAGRCYEPSTTAPDVADPNQLRIGMAACTASAPNGSAIVMDTFAFHVTAPEGFYITRISFTQNGTTSGSRGGKGFRGANWTIDKTPATVSTSAGGWASTVDLSLQRKTTIPVSITTYLAAFGIQVVSGSASASNPVVSVQLAPLE